MARTSTEVKRMIVEAFNLYGDLNSHNPKGPTPMRMLTQRVLMVPAHTLKPGMVRLEGTSRLPVQEVADVSREPGRRMSRCIHVNDSQCYDRDQLVAVVAR